jgi:galactoside O-acetyltransferase
MITEEPNNWIDELIRHIPGRTGFLLRRIWMQYRLAALGEGGIFEIGTLVVCGWNISIGHRFSLLRYSALCACDGILQIKDRVSINCNVLVDASDHGRIIVGNDVLIGPNVVLRPSNHVFLNKDTPINKQGHSGGSITIMDDVWIGANAVVLADVTIGAHAVVAAGSVVTHDVEPWTVVGGVPARVISQR